MKSETNLQRLKNFSEEELAIFLCHFGKSDGLTMDDLSEVQERYKDEKPPDYESMLVWLRSPSY